MGDLNWVFFSPKNDTNYYLGIWYKTVSPQTVVWVANREYPILSSSASLSFGSDGNIVIFDSKMSYIVTDTSSSNATNTTLLDSGNLILIEQHSQVVWQSFDYPTDTLLLGMKLGYDHSTGSSQSQDPAPGVFPLVQDFMEGPEQLIIKNGSKIYQTGAARYFDLFVDGYKRLGIMSTYVTWDDDLRDSTISRIVLDVSGQLKLQSWPGGIQGWYTFEASTCGRSDCGSFSICNKTAQMPCGCLQGFKSESKGSWAQGPHYMWEVGAKIYVRKTELSCSNTAIVVFRRMMGF